MFKPIRCIIELLTFVAQLTLSLYFCVEKDNLLWRMYFLCGFIKHSIGFHVYTLLEIICFILHCHGVILSNLPVILTFIGGHTCNTRFKLGTRIVWTDTLKFSRPHITWSLFFSYTDFLKSLKSTLKYLTCYCYIKCL